MKAYFNHGGITIYHGDCREILPELPSESVHCCVTSPPYWGLRDYGVEGQIGLEKTPELYVAEMVAIFRQVKRVLRKDGTLWLNLGDSYAGSGKGADQKNGTTAGYKQGTNAGSINVPVQLWQETGLKNKDLCGIPWLVAFALRADGWYLRQDIIWSKPNPMPESVTDRCTKAHEYIFLLSKSGSYYYDAAAIKEPGLNPEDDFRRISQANGNHKSAPDEKKNGLRKRGHERPHDGFNGTWDALTKEQQQAFGANKRSVWAVATQPFPEAHFATFPPELIKPCILAGCPAGGTVLDPFMGAGTTALVAQQNHCKSLGIELNQEYIEIAAKRLSQEVLDFTSPGESLSEG